MQKHLKKVHGLTAITTAEAIIVQSSDNEQGLLDFEGDRDLEYLPTEAVKVKTENGKQYLIPENSEDSLENHPQISEFLSGVGELKTDSEDTGEDVNDVTSPEGIY
jgi:hypothetical protein